MSRGWRSKRRLRPSSLLEDPPDLRRNEPPYHHARHHFVTVGLGASDWVMPGCLRSVRCSISRSSGSPGPANFHVHERDLRTRSPTARGTPLPSKGGESEVCYPAAIRDGTSRPPHGAAGKMLLTDFCNHSLRYENPKNVRFSSARLSRTDRGHGLRSREGEGRETHPGHRLTLPRV